ncbi:MAG: ATP/GTP-binding protein [Coleofasciculus sp. C1-SOL-03]|uniref:GTP-binding protein n=1 Tax=Coleofasciculus sp. C1-SOL-03 TaxID=3069522 RepID=UPI0032FB9E79
MKNIRVVITGTVGAGKSTFVKTASEVDVVEIERNVSDSDRENSFKETTTIAFDFGRLVLDANKNLYIYGTPGQTRFDFMWDILIKGADAYILLVTANQPSSFSYAKDILAFMNDRVQVPMVIGLTHTDCSGALPAAEIVKHLGIANAEHCPPILNINPREKHSIMKALQVLTDQTI